MHLRHTKALALTTCIAFAVTAVADFPSVAGYDFGTVTSAQAGNGNGNGGGGGNGVECDFPQKTFFLRKRGFGRKVIDFKFSKKNLN